MAVLIRGLLRAPVGVLTKNRGIELCVSRYGPLGILSEDYAKSISDSTYGGVLGAD